MQYRVLTLYLSWTSAVESFYPDDPTNFQCGSSPIALDYGQHHCNLGLHVLSTCCCSMRICIFMHYIEVRIVLDRSGYPECNNWPPTPWAVSALFWLRFMVYGVWYLWCIENRRDKPVMDMGVPDLPIPNPGRYPWLTWPKIILGWNSSQLVFSEMGAELWLAA